VPTEVNSPRSVTVRGSQGFGRGVSGDAAEPVFAGDFPAAAFDGGNSTASEGGQVHFSGKA